MVRRAHDVLSSALRRLNQPLPRNTGGLDRRKRMLDCAVIRFLHQKRAEDGELPFDTIRAPFFEGQPLYDNAGFAAKNHIQIAVRTHRSILGYFRPLDQNGRPINFT